MAIAATAPNSPTAFAVDDPVTVCALAATAFMISDFLHEGLGHACIALLTVAPAGLLTTVAWSSSYDSKLVDAGGTLVNLAAAGIFWLLLRALKNASAPTRLFLLLLCAFNLMAGTGYFFFSGVTNFGDWAGVIAGLEPYLVWRIGLIVVGVLAYWGAVVVVGSALVRYVGVPLTDRTRYWRLALWSYLSAIAISTLGGLMNPLGLQYVLLSALPATAGANCGLLWMRYYIPKSTVPIADSAPIGRSRAWIAVTAVLSLAFVFILGRGIPLQR
jgi:hypothetical protein